MEQGKWYFYLTIDEVKYRFEGYINPENIVIAKSKNEENGMLYFIDKTEFDKVNINGSPSYQAYLIGNENVIDINKSLPKVIKQKTDIITFTFESFDIP
jgi:hypothetical protein